MSLMSNNPHLNNLSFDTTNSKTISTNYVNNSIIYQSQEKKNDSVQILLGSQDGAYDALSSAY
jgi:hypothetical protein